jgi:hypothetical protein
VFDNGAGANQQRSGRLWSTRRTLVRLSVLWLALAAILGVIGFGVDAVLGMVGVLVATASVLVASRNLVYRAQINRTSVRGRTFLGRRFDVRWDSAQDPRVHWIDRRYLQLHLTGTKSQQYRLVGDNQTWEAFTRCVWELQCAGHRVDTNLLGRGRVRR